METLTTIISFILLFGLISVPIILFVGLQKWNHNRYKFLTYLIVGLILTAGITFTFAWWSDYSDQLLMTNYGYDFDAMNETDRFEKVDSGNLERVRQLEIGYFGVGWPLKAIMAFVYYSPYLLIVYIVGHMITKAKRKRKNMRLT